MDHWQGAHEEKVPMKRGSGTRVCERPGTGTNERTQTISGEFRSSRDNWSCPSSMLSWIRLWVLFRCFFSWLAFLRRSRVGGFWTGKEPHKTNFLSVWSQPRKHNQSYIIPVSTYINLRQRSQRTLEVLLVNCGETLQTMKRTLFLLQQTPIF
jgi:hypothetical protein